MDAWLNKLFSWLRIIFEMLKPPCPQWKLNVLTSGQFPAACMKKQSTGLFWNIKPFQTHHQIRVRKLKTLKLRKLHFSKENLCHSFKEENTSSNVILREQRNGIGKFELVQIWTDAWNSELSEFLEAFPSTPQISVLHPAQDTKGQQFCGYSVVQLIKDKQATVPRSEMTCF